MLDFREQLVSIAIFLARRRLCLKLNQSECHDEVVV